MKDTSKVEELIERSKRKRGSISLQDENYDEITKKLEEEKVLRYSDLTNEDLVVINVKEDLKEFDYFNIEESEEVEIKNETFSKMPNVVNRNEAPLITFENIHLKYGKDEVVKNISLQIFRGEFVYFVGKSGAGKSSLIKMLYREVKNTAGRLNVDGENITRFKNSKLPKLRRKVGVVFQDFKLLSDKTVYENVMFSLEVTKYKKSLRKEKVLETLKKVGIIEKKDFFPNELSGGQQQRVAIARAIVSDPLILVADEPTGNLDPENAIAIMEILSRINETGTTIVMATHDVGIVNKYSSRVVLFKNGEIERESEGGYIYE